MKLSILVLLAVGATVNGFAPPSSRITPYKDKHHISTHVIASPAAVPSSTQLAALPFLTEETSEKLVLLMFEKAIEAGVPALFFALSAAFIVKLVRDSGGDSGRVNDLYSCRY